MGLTPIEIAAQTALIRAEGGKRFCAFCRRLRPADGFVKLKSKKGATIRCDSCAQKKRQVR